MISIFFPYNLGLFVWRWWSPLLHFSQQTEKQRSGKSRHSCMGPAPRQDFVGDAIELNIILYWFKSMKPLLIFVYIDDDRVYGFLRVIAGDELSKRTKFALIVWLGKNVSGIKRARMGTDKSSVKEVIRVSSLIVYRFQMSILPGFFFSKRISPQLLDVGVKLFLKVQSRIL